MCATTRFNTTKRHSSIVITSSLSGFKIIYIYVHKMCDQIQQFQIYIFYYSRLFLSKY